MKKMIIPAVLSFAAGFGGCLLIAALADRREAWDSALYFTAGIPAFCVVMFAVCYFFPRGFWAWPFVMGAGQFASVLINGSDLSLWPLGLIFQTVFAVPPLIAGAAAAAIANKISKNKKAAPGTKST